MEALIEIQKKLENRISELKKEKFDIELKIRDERTKQLKDEVINKFMNCIQSELRRLFVESHFELKELELIADNLKKVDINLRSHQSHFYPNVPITLTIQLTAALEESEESK